MPRRTPKSRREQSVNTKDEQIAAGTYRISELETLVLQKLMHQTNSLAREHAQIQEAAQKVVARGQRAQMEFMSALEKTKRAHGLGDKHDIMLDDEHGGTVFIPAQTVAPLPQKDEPKAEG